MYWMLGMSLISSHGLCDKGRVMEEVDDGWWATCWRVVVVSRRPCWRLLVTFLVLPLACFVFFNYFHRLCWPLCAPCCVLMDSYSGFVCLSWGKCQCVDLAAHVRVCVVPVGQCQLLQSVWAICMVCCILALWLFPYGVLCLSLVLYKGYFVKYW